ncbi:DUF599 domain-containing protein [Dissulfuribacter thermophilus]|nr:DUF599 domain-containing protein [Dissulfuribacter thermophilus]
MSKFYTLDLVGLILYFSGLFGYRFFLACMLRRHPDRLFLGKLQAYRNAWIATLSGGKDCIVVVQTLRNTIMSASFLASTSIVLIMGAFNLVPHLNTLERVINIIDIFGSPDPDLQVMKILIMIIILSYSFLNFTWYIREANYLGFMLNVPKDKLDKIEGGDSTATLSKLFLTAGINFSLGMRGYYFLIPLFMWLFSPVLMIIAIIVILFVLIRRDLGKDRIVTVKV